MGNTSRTQLRQSVYTKQERIAHIAREYPKEPILSLNHYLDEQWLTEAFNLVRKGGASGVDDVTKSEYGENLHENLTSLLDRAKRGLYRAPAVKRVEIPKGPGTNETRPIGMPTIEDKILQRGVKMLLEPIFEQSFYDFSFGFRPGRSPHQALDFLRNNIMDKGIRYILDVDIRKYFDSIDHQKLRDMFALRVRDGVVTRLIHKWLKAGILKEEVLYYPEQGTPQGGVISPLLSNIYLHVALDQWYVKKKRRRMQGRSFLVRFADDCVFGFECREDALRMQNALQGHLRAYGLELHPEKTKLIPFQRPPYGGKRDKLNTGTFNFLGFTHYWGKSKRNNWVVKRKTARDRQRRAHKKIAEWCKKNRHMPLPKQHVKIMQKLNGHYGYYGITGNFRCIATFYHKVCRIWHKWLSRRGGNGLTWNKFNNMLETGLRLPQPRIKHSYVT